VKKIVSSHDVGLDDMEFLYDMLASRPECVKISSKAPMPTWDEHLTFWADRPYRYARVIKVGDKPAGYCYISRNDPPEIAVHLIPEHQRHGIGTRVFKVLLDMTEGKGVANISQRNEMARNFLKSLGFNQIQETYSHE